MSSYMRYIYETLYGSSNKCSLPIHFDTNNSKLQSFTIIQCRRSGIYKKIYKIRDLSFMTTSEAG